MSGYKKAYVNGNFLAKLYSNGSVVNKLYSDDNNIYQRFYDGSAITGISFSSLTWVTDIPYSGGWASQDNCSYTVAANLLNGDSIDVTSQAVIWGGTSVSPTTAITRQEVGTLILTAYYSGFSTTGSVGVYQEAAPASITSITLSNLVWVTDIPASGGTATSANCSYNVYANWNDGNITDITSSASVDGLLNVDSTTATTRENVGTLILTAYYNTFSNSASVGVYQEAYTPCTPIVMKNYLGQANNAGRSKSNFYCFDSGLTEITSCEYDWTGIKSFCSRNDGFYTTPNAAIDFNKPTASGSLGTIRYFEADTPDLTYISYPFGCDSTSQVSQTITSCTITSTNNVTYIRQMFRYCTNLVNLTLGDLSRASSAEKGHFQGCTHLQNVYIEKLPDEDMSSGSTTSSWCWNQATALTETSLINILNALPTTSNSRTIGIGAVNKAKLTSTAGQTALANAQSKGWTVN